MVPQLVVSNNSYWEETNPGWGNNKIGKMFSASLIKRSVSATGTWASRQSGVALCAGGKTGNGNGCWNHEPHHGVTSICKWSFRHSDPSASRHNKTYSWIERGRRSLQVLMGSKWMLHLHVKVAELSIILQRRNWNHRKCASFIYHSVWCSVCDVYHANCKWFVLKMGIVLLAATFHQNESQKILCFVKVKERRWDQRVVTTTAESDRLWLWPVSQRKHAAKHSSL